MVKKVEHAVLLWWLTVTSYWIFYINATYMKTLEKKSEKKAEWNNNFVGKNVFEEYSTRLCVVVPTSQITFRKWFNFIALQTIVKAERRENK